MATTTRPAAPARPVDRPRPPRRYQSAWVGLGLLAFFPGLYAIMLRVFPPTYDDSAALSASFIPYGIVFTAVSLILFLIALLRARRRTVLGLIAVVVAVLLAWQVSWQAPLFVADDRPLTTKPITVVSLNMRAGGADQHELAADTASADIVVLVEATPWVMRELRTGPMSEHLPYSVPADQPTENGSLIMSRFPLSHATALPPTSWQMWSAVARVPQIGNLTVVGAHPCNPYCGTGKWMDEHVVLAHYLSTLGSGPVVVAGDFNAVDDHAPMRQLAAQGYESATDIAGAGWIPTYPSNSVIPPLLPIDHVLLNRRLTATSVSSFRIDGTDHRGLRAVIAGTG